MCGRIISPLLPSFKNRNQVCGVLRHAVYADRTSGAHGPVATPLWWWSCRSGGWCCCWPCPLWPRPGYTGYRRRCRNPGHSGWRWCSGGADRSTCSRTAGASSPRPPGAAHPPSARSPPRFSVSSPSPCNSQVRTASTECPQIKYHTRWCTLQRCKKHLIMENISEEAHFYFFLVWIFYYGLDSSKRVVACVPVRFLVITVNNMQELIAEWPQSDSCAGDEASILYFPSVTLRSFLSVRLRSDDEQRIKIKDAFALKKIK